MPLPAARIIFMFVLFAVLFGTGQFHRISTATIMPELDRELALGAAALGLISGVYFLSAAMLQLPIGLSFDRFGVRRTVATSMIASVAGTLWFASAHDATSLMASRALMGMGFTSVSMGALTVFARWVRVDRLSTANAWLLAFGNFGGIMATAPLAFAVAGVGWRPTIAAVGVLTVVLAIATFVGVRDAPPGYVDKGRRPANLRDNLRGLVDILSERDMRHVLSMGVATFAPGTIVIGLWGGPFLADVYGLDTATRGNILLMMAIASAIGLIVIGPLDRLFNSRKRVVVMFALAKAAAFFALAVWAEAGLWLVAPLMIWIMFSQSYYVTLQSQCRSIFPETMVGRAGTSLNLVAVIGIAAMQMISGAIIAAFPAATGIASAGGYRWVFAFVGIAIVLAVAGYARVSDAPVRPA